MMTAVQESPLILLTGATGYVGGRLRRVLEKQGARVRCLVRNPEYLRSRVPPATEVVQGDLLDASSLRPAMSGVDVAYYLVHSMGATGDFQEQDRVAARNFAAAAQACGIKKIIYLGGLGSDDELSPHLASRHEVGRILRQSGVTTLEFRASIIIGSGSLSFEMIRALVDKLPVMITPRWVREKAQPIAIDDVLCYLAEAVHLQCAGSRVFEIGGPDQVSYEELMREYARQRGLRRWIIRVPVLTPRLSSLWLGLVTPVFARIGRKLVESLKHPTVVEDRIALETFRCSPRGMQQAVRDALSNEDRDFAESRWSDALSSSGGKRSSDNSRFDSRFVDSYSTTVQCSPQQAFRTLEGIGGDGGWFAANWLWRIRGMIDLCLGGVGWRRRRRHPVKFMPGDTVGFWRVEAVVVNRLLRFAAEMKLPGRAWLQFEVEPREAVAVIRQTAVFDPLGLWGRVYWYSLYPLHRMIFSKMLGGIARAAENRDQVPRRFPGSIGVSPT